MAPRREIPYIAYPTRNVTDEATGNSPLYTTSDEKFRVLIFVDLL